ncbi:MAG: transglutaminase domain-containing protein [Planctomycetota bacterium]
MARFIQCKNCYALSFAALLIAFLATSPSTLIAQNRVVDTDNDGLSDFHETFKHLTDPQNPDSDGDGTPDGDWLERREYQYTIRSVVQVLRPVTPEYLNDDYQDARVLDETERYFELEVIHYPFNKVSKTIPANENWREDTKSLGMWTEPGPSNDWTPKMQQELMTKLKASGIDTDTLNDKQLVEQASRWLCNHAKHEDGFTSFLTAWDESGKPYVPDALLDSAKRGMNQKNRELKDQFEREVSAAGMFKHQQRGSCTSSAIYLNGCFKALGIPTRTVLCIPVIDAGDEREMAMLNNIRQLAVRQHLRRSLEPLKNSWSSHTFNEVYVGGRWRRLNYHELGQGIYDKNLYGLITHVATVNDWADAKAHETIGMRQKTNNAQDIFGGNNPYSTISLRDQIGKHCELNLPEPAPVKPHLVEKIYWTDDEALPNSIRENCKRRGRFGLIAVVSGCGDQREFRSFLGQADLRVHLAPSANADKPTINITFDPGCFWLSNDTAYIYVPIAAENRRELVKDIKYSFQPQSDKLETGWKLEDELGVTRKKDIDR